MKNLADRQNNRPDTNELVNWSMELKKPSQT